MINLIFKAEDFRGLSFAIQNTDPTLKLFDQIPDLIQIKEFEAAKSNPNCDKFIRYIILMYDKNSPLAKKFTDLQKRKENAATMAGFDLIKDNIAPAPTVDDDGEIHEIPSLLQTLFDFLDSATSDMVIGFLRYQNDLLFSMLVSNEQTFYEYQKALLSEVMMIRNDKDKITALAVKSKIMDDSDIIALRIEKYYKQLYVDDKAIAYVKKRASSPESNASN